MIWRFKDHSFDLSDRTLVMGVINLSKESFYSESYYQPESAAEIARLMEEDGADIIDIGAQSSRPGSDEIPLSEEISRMKIALPAIINAVKIPVSIDTYRSAVADYGLKTGASILNDISGLRFDPEMVEVVKKSDCGIVIMHIKGRPKDMQKNPEYQDLIGEVYNHLKSRLDFMKSSGIDLERVVIDPGLGFGKKIHHNYQLIKNLKTFLRLNRPILVGISRKSFTGASLNIPPKERLSTSIALETMAVMSGARILRVHDVLEVKRVVRIIEEFNRCQSWA